MEKYLRIIDTARREEIFAYEALKDLLFRDVVTYVGDDTKNGVADIFTDDMSIGVEVVTCERRTIHKFTEKNKLPINFSMKVRDKVKSHRVRPESSQVDEEAELYHNMKLSVFKKLRKLKQGNYSGTEQIYLCICSVYEDKPYMDLSKVAGIYKEGVEKTGVQFDAVFLIVNKNLYMINNEYRFAIIDDYMNSRINVVKINK